MGVFELKEKAAALVGQSVHIYTNSQLQDVPSICKLTAVEGSDTLILKGRGPKEIRVPFSDVAHLSKHETWKFQVGPRV